MDRQLKRILEATLRMMPQTLGDTQLEMLRSGLQDAGSAVRALWEATIQACWIEQSQGDTSWNILQAAYREACDQLAFVAPLLELDGATPEITKMPANTELGSLMNFYLDRARNRLLESGTDREDGKRGE